MKSRNYIKIKNLKFKWFFLFTILINFLFTNKTIAQTTPEIITSGSSSWTSPVGITSFTVEVWGGGGAGGGCPANTRMRGGSGGTGGTYVRNTYTPAGPTTYNYVVGASRPGTNNANGANGNFSWFSGVGIQYATGGLGGKVGTGAAVTGSSAGSFGTTIVAGANTLAGTGTTGSTIGSAGSAGANGGGAGGGTNTATATSGSIAGFNGTAPGGGGGGASTQLNTGTFPNVPGGTGERGEIRITYLHINSLGNTLGCLGSTITINGTDFTGATAAGITIGGTPVSSIVSNTGTQIVAVVGAGTTGTVSITIAGKGTTTSSQTFTINNPVNPGNPTSDSPQCLPTGVTITRAGSVPGGETWYWQTVSGGTSTTNSGNTYVVTTSGTYYIRSRNNTSGCWSSGEGSITVVVNPLPANPGNPTSNSPQCTSPGVTLTRSGIVPGGETWYWQTTALGTATTNSAATYVVTTSGTYYIRSQNNTTGCWSAASGSLAVVINTIPTFAITPSPTNNATGVCYAGIGAITNVSWATTATATSYDVYFGAGSLPGTVTSNVATNSYTTGTLLANTTYYWKVVPKNSCGGAVGSTTWTFTTAGIPCVLTYCTPTGNLNCTTSGDYIANVTLNTLNNNTTCAASGYTNFAPTGTQTTTVTRGNAYNLIVGTGIGNRKHGLAAWIDFNQNQVFDATEYFTFGNGIIANSTNTLAITIPVGATLGTVGMRIRYGRQTNVTSASACTMGGSRGETEDYFITIIDPLPCAAPIAQPTSLILNATANNISGSFTAPSPAPNNYLVVINTTGTTPSPVNTTSYAIGGTVGAGNTVVDNDSNLTFTATGLTASTTYYIFVFSYNSACSGGPTYNITSPLNGSILTIAANYCIPSVTNPKQADDYISEISFIGTLNDVSNYSTYSSSPLGYQDFTGLSNLSQQAQGEGVNILVQALLSSYIKAWVDWNKDGLFDPTSELVYNSGGISTGSTTFGFIIPPTQNLGNYRVRIRINLNNGTGLDSTTFTSCNNLNNGGETEDYLFTVVASCNSLINSVTDGRTCGPGTVNLIVGSSSVGVTEYRWYSTPTGSTLVGTTPTGSWTTPSINSTTTYYVTAYNGCESLVRTAINAIISPIPTLTYSSINPTICGENTVITLNATGDLEEVFLIDEKFNSGLGTFTNTNIASTARDTETQWKNRTSTYIPTVITNVNTWYPAISTGVNGNKFAMATSDFSNATPFVHNQLASATLNSTSFVNLVLSLRMYYSRYFIDDTNLTLDYVTIDVSTNGGGAWTEIKRFTEDVGIGTRFETLTYDLSAYINQSNLKVRVRYYGTWCDGVAVDDIKLYGNRPIGTSLSWTSATPVNAYTIPACTPGSEYVSGTPVENVYIKPTLAQLEQESFSFTATAILANGCSTSQTIIVTNNSKTWQGGTNWENPANWKPSGIPTSASCVIVPSTIIIPGNSYQAYAKNVTVKPTGILDITSGGYLTVTDFVDVNPLGVFSLKNSSSLIQINDSAINSGNITMERTTNVRKTDYVYWSSPVENFSTSAISPGTSSNYIYKWNPSIANANNGQGSWVSGIETMVPGKGYLVRGPDSYTSSPANYTATFTGKPLNGIISPSITRGDITSVAGAFPAAPYAGTNGVTITERNDNWNLIGNPYPSAISALSFLSLNALTNNRIVGNVRLWTHGTAVSSANANSFYATYGYNYSPTDYVNYNGTGAAIPGFSGLIGAGQGFFVLMNEAPTPQTSTVTFQNSMRSNTFRNDQFYRQENHTESTTDLNTIDRNRVWLSLVNSTNIANTTLVGYVDGATLGEDILFDAPHFITPASSIYSLTEDKPWVIQGRPTPFDPNDVVPIGVVIPSNDIYKIALSEVDGLFDNNEQGIYLEDTSLGIIHDLRASPYTFTAVTGVYNSRFKLRYTTVTLGIDNPDVNQTFAFINNNQLHIQSNDSIKEIIIYDISGKMVKKYQPNELKNQFKADFFFANGAYIAKIKLDDGSIVSKKLLN